MPPGTILLELRDADDHPVPHEPATVGVLHQSVAKGESREHKTVVTDDTGFARVGQLETGSGVAYRITSSRDGATFAASPFQLSQSKGTHVVLHVYPATPDLQKALIVMQAILFAELRDDRVQIQEALSVYNLGRIAWVPAHVTMRLPEGFTALNNAQQMSDDGVDPVEHVGASLRGTFPPGRNDLEFRWQLPYEGESEVTLDVGLPPHVAMMRVMALAAEGMELAVEGFPSPEARTDNQGQHLLVSERQLRREDAPLEHVRVSLRNLPTPGPGRIIATSLAGLTVGLGLVLGAGRKPRDASKRKTDRSRLLAELEELEVAKARGDVGPKTYEKERRTLIDALAKLMAEEPPRP